MNIQQAHRSHLERLCEIEREAFHLDRFNQRQFEYLMTKANSVFRVGILEKQVVGYYILLKRKKCRFSRLYSLAVDRGFEGRSLGCLLIQNAESETKKAALKEIRLEVRVDNYRARQFYCRQDFLELKVVENYYEDGQSAIKMTKTLEE